MATSVLLAVAIAALPVVVVLTGLALVGAAVAVLAEGSLMRPVPAAGQPSPGPATLSSGPSSDATLGPAAQTDAGTPSA